MRSRKYPAAALILLAACKGEPDPDDTVPPPPELPRLEVASPARGAFVPGSFEVRGEATAGTGAITKALVNDVEVDLDADGGFRTTIDAPPGIAIVSTRVEDDLGERAVDGRAVQVGPVHPPATVLPHSVGLQLGPELLDDDHPSLDDLAAVAEAVIEDPGFASLIVGQTFEGLVDVTVTGITFSHADVDLIPNDDGITYVDLYLHDVVVTFATSFIGIPIDGAIHSSRVVVQNDVVLGSSGGAVTANVTWSLAVLEGFWWEASYVPGFLEDLLEGTVRDSLEASLEEQAQGLLGTLLTESLSAFAVDTVLGDDLRLSMRISSASASALGLVLWLDTAVYALHPAFPLPVGGGSLATPGAAPSLPMVLDQPFAAVIDDDFVNQTLFAFWQAGSLGGFEVSGTELALMTGDDLPPPLGPVASATLDLKLPPILSPPTTGLDLDLSVGELVLSLTRDDGERIDASLQARTGADVLVIPGGLSLAVDDRPAYMTVAAGVTRFPNALDPGDLASLFRLAVPTMLGSASSLFPAFPAPEIPIGELVDVPALNGLTWSLSDVTVEVTDTGWIRLDGRMEGPP